jgi:hypothetical protein
MSENIHAGHNRYHQNCNGILATLPEALLGYYLSRR